jgi:protein-S-isoprenylcysteine O-methyltransferase Ste14
VAIPSVIQMMTGESHRVSNMKATLELINLLPDDEEELKSALRNSLRREAKVDRSSSLHVQYLALGALVILACLVCSYFVMQPPGSGQTRSELHSLFILLALAFYVVGAVAVVHGAHLLGRNLHLFRRMDSDQH